MSFLSALNINAQRIRTRLRNPTGNHFVVASHKETIRQYKTLAGDMASFIGRTTFNWDRVESMTIAKFRFRHGSWRSFSKMLTEAADHGFIVVTQMSAITGPMVAIKIMLVGQFWSEGTFWAYTYEDAAELFWKSVLGELVMGADHKYRQDHTKIPMDSSIEQYIQELDMAIECIAAQLMEPMHVKHNQGLVRMYQIIASSC